jgi:very-short-patch-repair endonuclease
MQESTVNHSEPNITATGSAQARIAASVDNWKRRLLDLTKRNRALNFRPARISNVAMVEELPSFVFRRLSLEEKSLKFRPVPHPPPPSPSGRGDGGEGEVGEADDDAILEATASPIGEALPYDPATLEERQTDDALQTNATAEQLDKSLRRLDELARSAIEEQGVNALFLMLGMLNYAEASEATEFLKAPLVLVPASLARRSARTGYTLSATEEDPLVNPALIEYLKRVHNLSLPELPDSSAMPDDYDVQQLFDAVAEAVSTQKGWSVTPDIYLGMLSFQKFVMYKDLEANSQAFQGHRLVQQLVTRNGPQFVGLPEVIRALELDRDYPPEQTFQVVDADSSQIRAIAAAARGFDLVIEGPPGTGKSQTITNLIAAALAEGKSVLFVAEKMAALQVVHQRLVAAGLGEFCLELHSTKANKRAVMRQLAAALDASLQRPVVPTLSTERLPPLRGSLTDYVQAAHSPFGAIGLSPFRACGELGAVIDAPRLRFTGPVESVTRDQLDQTVRELNALQAASTACGGDPSIHPWRDSSRTFFTEDDLEDIGQSAGQLLDRLADVQRPAAAVETAFGFGPICTFADVTAAAAIAEVMARSPGAPLGALQSEAWNAPPPEALALVERGRRIERLKAHVFQRLAPGVMAADHAGDIAYVERKHAGAWRLLAFLDSRYRAIQQRWVSYRLPAYRPSLIEQAADMRQVEALRQEQAALAASDAEARQLFGALWHGEQSSWEALGRYIDWVVELRALIKRHAESIRDIGPLLELATHPAPDMHVAAELNDAATAAGSALRALGNAAGWPDGYLGQATFAEQAERVTALRENLNLAPRWAAFEAARAAAAQGLAAEALPETMLGQVPFAQLAPAFLRAFYQRLLAAAMQAREPLRGFHTLTHEQRIAEFRDLDRRVLLENRAALVARARERVQTALRTEQASAAMPFLRREMARQRGLSPLRRTMHQAEAAIRAIKPCFMMSPLTVAQLLDGAHPGFDIVIFDEASQLPPEDAVGAIARGRQLVVVGDPKQLPPTNFFAVLSGQVSAPLAEDGTPLYEDSESILEEYLGSGVAASRLKWHYRSRHESLIAFSNASFYDSDLYTFPSVEIDSHTLGVRFEFVEGGVYEGKGLNLIEARRVADAVMQHAREHPGLSLGVGTFSLRQQIAIQDEIEQRRRQDPSTEAFFGRQETDSFFVKNLENIQGDERDVIFVSVTYARGPDGRLRYLFGPLNAQNGWRRLNVLATRARQLMRVFSSIHGEDISVSATGSLGAKLLRDFLTYAEHGRLDGETQPVEAGSARFRKPAGATAEAESPLERDVYRELAARGVSLAPQVGVSGYRIDLGVLDDEAPGRFVCGIECDGAAYHASQTARDRDRLRQQVLEERGWTIHRAWSADWYKDRAGQIDRLLALIAEAREAARQAVQAEARPGDPTFVVRHVAAQRRSGAVTEIETSGALDAPALVETNEAQGSGATQTPGVSEETALAASREVSEQQSGAAPTAEPRAVTPAPLHPRSPAQPGNAEPIETPTVPTPELPDYERPELPSYRFAPGAGRYADSDILRATANQLRQAVARVVESESPVHLDDLVTRVAGMWSTRPGARIRRRILEVFDQAAATTGQVERRGEFAWKPGKPASARSRGGTRIPPERIAPEEYRAAALLVLQSGHGFTRAELKNEVRAILGYGRLNEEIDQAVEAQINALLNEGLLGEGSAGLRLRE